MGSHRSRQEQVEISRHLQNKNDAGMGRSVDLVVWNAAMAASEKATAWQLGQAPLNWFDVTGCKVIFNIVEVWVDLCF